MTEPAHWLAQSVGRTAGAEAVLTAENGLMLAPLHMPTILQQEWRPFAPLQPPRPIFLPTGHDRHPASLRGRLKGRSGSPHVLGMRPGAYQQATQVLFI